MKARIFRGGSQAWWLDITLPDGQCLFKAYPTWAEALAALQEYVEPKKAQAA